MRTNKKFIFLFSLFVILSVSFLSTVSAVSVSQLQTYNLPYSRGTSLLEWDSSGNNLIAIDDCNSGGITDYATVYNTPSSYDITSLSPSSFVNLSSLFPVTNLSANGRGYNLNNLSDGFSTKAAYITRNGKNLYLVLTNGGCTWADTNGIHSQSLVILHYTLNSSFDLSTLTYQELAYYYGGENGGGFQQLAGTYGATYTIPQVRGIYVSDTGNYMTISGNWFVTGQATNSPKFFYWNLTTAYNFTAMVNGTSRPIISTGGNFTYPFTFYRPATPSQFAFYSNIQVSPDGSFYNVIERNQHSGSTGSTVSLGISTVSNGSKQDVVSSANDFSGVTTVSSYTNIYLFTQSGGVLYKYQVNDLTTQISEAENQTQGQETTTQLVNAFTNLFPPASTLSFGQRTGFVVAIMVLTALGLLIAASSFKNGVNVIVLWIVLIIEVVEFIYFVAIGYINIGVLVLLALIALAVAYLAFRQKG